MQPMQPARPPRQRSGRALRVALIMAVMFLPATTLYSQIVGQGTTIFVSLYVGLMIASLVVSRLVDVPAVVRNAPVLDPRLFSDDR